MTNGMRSVLATTVALSAVTLFAGWEDEAWRFARTTVYCPKTKLVYDYRVGTGENALVGCLPTPKEIRANFPVVTGWSTGMEDSVLSGTTLLLAAMARYDRLGEPETLDFLHDLFDGLCHCCEYAKVPGFLARSICPADGRSHYINSSRDQYTLYVYAFWQYYRWPKATEAERARIRKILVDIARYAEKCVTPENNYSLLREDGGNAFVCKMWTATPCVDCNPKGTLADYGEIHPHETLRLPEIYAAAHAVSGDRHWREMELKYADPGIEMSNGPIRQRMLGYALYQMQISVNLLYTCETDAARKARYLGLLKRCVSLTDDCFDYIRKKNAELKGDYYATIPNWRTLKFSYLHWKGFHVDDVWSMHADWPKQFEDTSFVTREVAEFVLIASLCPGAEIPQSRIDILESVFAKLDFSRFNQSSGPVHALLAKERLLATAIELTDD